MDSDSNLSPVDSDLSPLDSDSDPKDSDSEPEDSDSDLDASHQDSDSAQNRPMMLPHITSCIKTVRLRNFSGRLFSIEFLILNSNYLNDTAPVSVFTAGSQWLLAMSRLCYTTLKSLISAPCKLDMCSAVEKRSCGHIGQDCRTSWRYDF